MKVDHKEVFQNVMAIGILVACFIYFFWISSSEKATNNQHIGEIKILCASAVTLILQYYFGSSRGSLRNAETIRNMVNPPDGTTTIKTESPTRQPETREQKQKRLDDLTAIQEPDRTIEQSAEILKLMDELKNMI